MLTVEDVRKLALLRREMESLDAFLSGLPHLDLVRQAHDDRIRKNGIVLLDVFADLLGAADVHKSLNLLRIVLRARSHVRNPTEPIAAHHEAIEELTVLFHNDGVYRKSSHGGVTSLLLDFLRLCSAHRNWRFLRNDVPPLDAGTMW